MNCSNWQDPLDINDNFFFFGKMFSPLVYIEKDYHMLPKLASH